VPNTGKLTYPIDHIAHINLTALKIFYPYQMDTDREINALKKLILSASGERLIQLTQRLSFLLMKKQDEERARQRQNQEEDTIEPDKQPLKHLRSLKLILRT
jgi:hypothetical protein